MMGLFNDANDDMKEILHEEQKNLNKDFLCKGMCGVIGERNRIKRCLHRTWKD